MIKQPRAGRGLNRTVLLFLITFGALLDKSGLAAQQEGETTPYLYYFSDYYNSFIIEQADGTDSRFFAPGIMTPDTQFVDGGGWSPSGHWFAWRSSSQEYYAVEPRVWHGWTISADNTERLTLLDNLVNVQRMIWSPTEDLLFVIDSPDKRDYRYQAYLIDVPDGKILYTEQYTDEESWIETAEWSPNGEYLIFLRESDRHTELVIITSEGEKTVRDVPSPNERPTRVGTLFPMFPRFTPDGRLITRVDDDTALMLETVGQNEKTKIATDGEQITAIYWNSQGTLGLLFNEELCTTTPCLSSWWLLDLTTDTVMLLLENAVAPWISSDSPDSWYRIASPWDPNGISALLSDRSGNYFIFEGANRNLTQIALPNVEAWYWINSDLLVSGRFVDGDDRLDMLAYQFTVSTQQVNLIHLPGTDSFPVFFSPDGDWALALIEHDETYGYLDSPVIFDFTTLHQIIIPSHSGKHPQAGIGGNAQMHPSGNWVIAAEMNAVAGGGVGPLLFRVINADGSHYRDLNQCTGDRCADWLPSQVQLVDLPAISSEIDEIEAVHSYPTTGYVTGLSWSPDSRYLMSSSDGAYGADWDNIVDTQTGIVLPYELLTRCDQLYLEWILLDDIYTPTCDGGYVARSNNSRYVAWSDNQLWLFDSTGNTPLVPLEDGGQLMSLSFSPDGQLLAGGGSSGFIRIWEADNGALLGALNIRGNGVAFSPDGEYLAIGVSWNIQLYRMTDIQPLLANLTEH